MLTWETLDILSYGAGTPSTTLALMACENALCGQPYPYPQVPIYDAVIFCDLHGEPSWVYRQAAFTAAACDKAGIPFYTLEADLYKGFLRNFGRSHIASFPFWTLGKDGKKAKMPRQRTYDYKIKVIERFVRRDLWGHKPHQRTLAPDVHTHRMHMGIMWVGRTPPGQAQQIAPVRRPLSTGRNGLAPSHVLCLKLGGVWAGDTGELLPVLHLSGAAYNA